MLLSKAIVEALRFKSIHLSAWEMFDGSRLWQEASRRFIKVSSFSKGHEVESASRQNNRASFACHYRFYKVIAKT